MSVLKPSDVLRSFFPGFKWQVVQESKAKLLDLGRQATEFGTPRLWAAKSLGRQTTRFGPPSY
jgi:hypothetical protein